MLYRPIRSLESPVSTNERQRETIATTYHLDPPDLPRHIRVSSNWGPAAGGGQTVLADDRNGGKLRLNAWSYDDDFQLKQSDIKNITVKNLLTEIRVAIGPILNLFLGRS